MRLALKHQIILAPATVLLFMTLLLIFLQYTYWDLSVKRKESRSLATVFIALAESDLAVQRMYGLTIRLREERTVNVAGLEDMAILYRHLEGALERILTLTPLSDSTRALLRQTLRDLNPEYGFDAQRYLASLSLLRPQLVSLAELTQKKRERLRDVHNQDIDAMVDRTAFVSLVVLGVAILIGIFLSLAFARRILHRIQFLSDSAGRVARGDLMPPPAPDKVRDELDELAVSINRMTDQLIRVVGAEKLLEGAEEERRRIAMDLHDQTLADLAAILRTIQDLKKEENCLPEAIRLEEDLQRTMTNLREVMDNLHPQTLEILGLGAALQSHLERHLAKDNLPQYHLYISPEAETAGLSRLVRLTLYRIAIEAIHNVIKHAQASRYEVNLSRRGNEIVLAVEDNGIGFGAAMVDAHGGRGLNNIRERARAIGASVAWGASRFTSGTRFELALPLANHHGG
jgi:two-component system, NarL family, sensor histidine kinase UhpB